MAMQNDQDVKSFFDDFERIISGSDGSAISTLYADPFSFGGADGVQTVALGDFLRALPKRQGFFASIGLKSTRLISVETEQLDPFYSIARAEWLFHYEKEGKAPVDDRGRATYILFKQDGQYKIVMQIDHQDLVQRAKELGLA
jgi:ketosteroid isomerase-like protein